MTHEELVEAVARNFADGFDSRELFDDGGLVGSENATMRMMFMDTARTAIATIAAALKEPTEEMVRAGVEYRLKTTIRTWPADTVKLLAVILSVSPLFPKKDKDND